MLGKILDDFMSFLHELERKISVLCPKVDKSGVEGKSRCIIRVYIRESNYGESRFSSDFVFGRDVCSSSLTLGGEASSGSAN